MDLVAVVCASCGGAVAMKAGAAGPVCLFCGAAELRREAPPEVAEAPQTCIGFLIDEAGAKAAFRKFSSSSIWYPSDLRDARLALNRVLLPAWSWRATVETHYAALIPDGDTRSGKRPLTGREVRIYPQVLIPASSTLSRAELAAVSPFKEKDEAAFDPTSPAAPYEIGRLSRAGAEAAGREALLALVERDLAGRLKASRVNASCLMQDMSGRPLLLPVYVGAYRYGEKLYRIVINGQTGKLHGTAPRSAIRVAAAVIIVLGLLFFLTICSGLLLGR